MELPGESIRNIGYENLKKLFPKFTGLDILNFESNTKMRDMIRTELMRSDDIMAPLVARLWEIGKMKHKDPFTWQWLLDEHDFLHPEHRETIDRMLRLEDLLAKIETNMKK